jgi:hypothetical protein
VAAFQKVNSFVEAIALKKHNLGTDQIMIALCATANPPVAANAVLADLVQIAYTNLSARILTTISATQVAGVFSYICADLTLTAAGGSVAAFQYVVLYNNTATNKEIIGFYDIGAPVTLLDTQTYPLDFNQTTGVFQIA